jgi:chromosome condensin MukBEF ATPase and DNA-binding subunit MukB
MNSEIIQKLFQVKSSTIDDMKDLLHQIKSYKDEKLAQRVKELEDELKEIQKAKKY